VQAATKNCQESKQMKITARRIRLAWKYRGALWKYRAAIRRRREIAGATAAALGAAAVATFLIRRRA
jgi:hypothetical protein